MMTNKWKGKKNAEKKNEKGRTVGRKEKIERRKLKQNKEINQIGSIQFEKRKEG